MSLSWEEPPASPHVQATLQDQLRERTGSWAKVLTADKIAVSRLGGELHQEGFEIRPDAQPDAAGTYSLYARWNPGGSTTTLLRPGAGEPVPATDALLDDALAHLLAATVASSRDQDGPVLDDLLSGAREQVKDLFSSSEAPRRYLRGVESQQP